MKTHSTEALCRLLPISSPWGRRVPSTNPIRGFDLRIRLAPCWTRKYQLSASSTGSHHKKSWKNVERNTSSRLAPRPHPKRVRHFKRPAWTPLSLPASKPAGIAVHSSEAQRIHLQGHFH